ncbi:MAG: type II secretion system protein GspF [Gammaproteobacteria bacterium CG22_combo_CG10-13_8_21_14_all_40_8]|nr:MAG: type II secretion system protein GspF [Gammaproteobacteria bacterium CG22_combo_CG10-13_8_21_14_all_40_8]
MAAFEYLALAANGRQKKGVLEGDNARQIRQQLREKQLIPLEVTAVVSKDKAKQHKTSSKSHIKTADLSLITRQLATLIDASIPIEEALRAAADQVEKPQLQSMLMAIRARVVEGHTFADALLDFPHAFDHLFRSMISAGEKSGHLGPVLNRLADYIEKREETRNKIMLALIYPVVLVVLAIGVVSGLLAYVVPTIVDQFKDLGGELPYLTQVMLSLSEFIRHWGLVVIAGIIALGFYWRWYLSNEKRQLGVHTQVLKMPILGRVTRDLNSARFARTLAIMTSSGIPLLEGLKISGQVLTNLQLRKSAAEAAVRVSEGSSLRQALGETKQFPPMMLHMIASGENSGELESMLERTANSQDREFANRVNITLGLFEPLIIIVMGGLILLIVLAILLPIFDMNTLINK